MIVFEIVVPGSWLDYQDEEFAYKIRGQLDALIDCFFDANIAFNLFNESYKEDVDAESRIEAKIQDQNRISEIQQEFEVGAVKEFSKDQWEINNTRARRQFNHERWSQGELPSDMKRRLPFIHARTFLYALDAFDKQLGILSRENGAPPELQIIHSRFIAEFPDLRLVRNTAQHLEDRLRGIGERGKPLDLKPIDKGGISAPNGGVLVPSNLHGSKYGSVMANGEYGEIDVSHASLEKMQKILHESLESFKWRGSKDFRPYS